MISGKSNAAKAKVGELVYNTTDLTATLDFINRFRKDYFDIDEPYELDIPMDIEEDPTKEDEEFETIVEEDEEEEEEEGEEEGF